MFPFRFLNYTKNRTTTTTTTKSQRFSFLLFSGSCHLFHVFNFSFLISRSCLPPLWALCRKQMIEAYDASCVDQFAQRMHLVTFYILLRFLGTTWLMFSFLSSVRHRVSEQCPFSVTRPLCCDFEAQYYELSLGARAWYGLLSMQLYFNHIILLLTGFFWIVQRWYDSVWKYSYYYLINRPFKVGD